MSNFDGITPRFCEAWERQDLDTSLEFIHRDIVYSMFIPEDVVPFGGETRGKPAMTDRMKTILEQFAMVRFETILFRRDGNTEYTRVAYEFRHRLTGETIAGVMRIITRVDNGLIYDLKEFHDLEMVKAFMRLIAYKASEA
ncbi:MAG: nuclear transport factor 2 family protein [Pseudomonadota bacterium]